MKNEVIIPPRTEMFCFVQTNCKENEQILFEPNGKLMETMNMPKSKVEKSQLE